MRLYSLPVAILFVATMAANLCSQIAKNSFVKKYPSAVDKYLFIAAGGAVSVAVILFLGKIESLSLFTLLTACGFGALTLIQSYFMLKALDCGSFAYTGVIISLSTVIPAFSGAIFWHEKLSALQITGIALLAACFVLCAGKDEEKKDGGVKWFIYVLVAFVATGLIGVMQKIHQTSEYADELNGFLTISFLISTLSAAICAVVAAVKSKSTVSDENVNADSGKKRSYSAVGILLIVLSGVGVALNNVINLYLSGKVDSAMFFPIVNGGGLVLVTISSVILYKEKLSKKQWAGVLIGIAAVIMLSL